MFQPVTVPDDEAGFLSILKDKFNFDQFFSGQFEAIQSLLDGDSTLVILQTGGGKSLTYQYTSLLLPGITLVITPLISLMADQLQKMSLALPAACLSS